jgi:hypothetical protein
VIHDQEATEHYEVPAKAIYGKLLGQQGVGPSSTGPRREARRLAGNHRAFGCWREGAQDRCQLPGWSGGRVTTDGYERPPDLAEERSGLGRVWASLSG